MEITANAIQTVAINADVLFPETAISGCPSIIHREGSGLVTLRGLTQRQPRARFRISFGANIAIPTDQTPVDNGIQLAIVLNGETLPATTMMVSPTDTDRYWNVDADTFVDIPACCCQTIAVRNTSTIPINVQHANLIVERVA